METLCDEHQMMRKISQFSRFKAGRLNTMGERVDIHQIKRLRKMEEHEKQQMNFQMSDKQILNR